jgi:hypothetical protein
VGCPLVSHARALNLAKRLRKSKAGKKIIQEKFSEWLATVDLTCNCSKKKGKIAVTCSKFVGDAEDMECLHEDEEYSDFDEDSDCESHHHCEACGEPCYRGHIDF